MLQYLIDRALDQKRLGLETFLENMPRVRKTSSYASPKETRFKIDHLPECQAAHREYSHKAPDLWKAIAFFLPPLPSEPTILQEYREKLVNPSLREWLEFSQCFNPREMHADPEQLSLLASRAVIKVSADGYQVNDYPVTEEVAWQHVSADTTPEMKEPPALQKARANPLSIRPSVINDLRFYCAEEITINTRWCVSKVAPRESKAGLSESLYFSFVGGRPRVSRQNEEEKDAPRVKISWGEALGKLKLWGAAAKVHPGNYRGIMAGGYLANGLAQEEMVKALTDDFQAMRLRPALIAPLVRRCEGFANLEEFMQEQAPGILKGFTLRYGMKFPERWRPFYEQQKAEVQERLRALGLEELLLSASELGPRFHWFGDKVSYAGLSIRWSGAETSFWIRERGVEMAEWKQRLENHLVGELEKKSLSELLANEDMSLPSMSLESMDLEQAPEL